MSSKPNQESLELNGHRATETGYRMVLSKGVTRILETHFGAVPAHVIYRGAVFVPPTLRSDCTELAKAVLAEEPSLADTFSVEDVSRRIEFIVITTVREGTSRTSDQIGRLCVRMERNDEAKLVLIPLQGIKLTEAVTKVGPFCLRLMDDEAVAEVDSILRATIDRASNTHEQKENLKDHFRADVESHLRGSVCLEVRLSADVKQAEAKAVEQATAVIDLLRYGSSGLHHKNMNLAIGFNGDAVPGICRRYILPLGDSEASLLGLKQGPFGTLELNEDCLRVMSDLGVQRLADALHRSMSQFEMAVVRAVHWFAESRRQIRPEYEIVTLVIAIESAFANPGKRSRGSDFLAKAVAVLLSDDEDERNNLYDLITPALQNRHGIVHSGVSVVEWDGLNSFRDVVVRFITLAIRSIDRFQTTAELQLWVDSKGWNPCPKPCPINGGCAGKGRTRLRSRSKESRG